MKKSRLLLILVLVFCCLPFPSALQAVDLQLNRTPVKVFFSPSGGCTDAVVTEIDQARSEVLVQAYVFTSAPIAKALLQAHRRGVRVEAILDKSQQTRRYSSATFLVNAGSPTYIDGQHAIAHNKVMIIDGERVISGSFNFTKAAEESNAENLVIIRSAELARVHLANWREHRAHSTAIDRLTLVQPSAGRPQEP
ncbi:MAG: phospholipase D family protein [Syntrophales bacterium]|jgi:phosphatidylserine/phosphatidylglycerophosphate/cardiolipin synthase-like enzyme|nr:phospholipase D family protein [Syntrophales bacterium]MDD4339877.1 phospholipase D family protein [Syntrophales bacterium]HOG07506.1 phospholipase D family protein [Syntrophales bacterium]HOS76778.1 phospholipase D family protein [Syntrophales bacterium]HPB69425.1 phospholipase D family protein [Syntrophales bacterium]